MMKRSFLLAVILAFILLLPVMAGSCFATDRFGAESSMQNAKYWIDCLPDAERVVMTFEEIENFNKAVTEVPNTLCRNVFDQKPISEQELLEMTDISEIVRKEYFVDGRPITAEFINELAKESVPTALKEPTYVVPTKITMMRLAATEKEIFRSAEDKKFDVLAETTVKIWEPLIVLGYSKSGKQLFVRSNSSQGWVKKDDVVFAEKERLQSLLSRFVIVTDPKVPLTCRGNDKIIATMGTKLPLAANDEKSDGSYAVLISERGKSGSVETKKVTVLTKSVNKGYLTYTQSNLLNQAFKLLGRSYGWGGENGLADCSGMIRDIYLTFGIELPRNSREQTKIPYRGLYCGKLSDSEKADKISMLPTGALLYMPGHTMLYIGNSKGQPYVVHALHSALDERGNILQADKIVISDLKLRRQNGKSFLSSITNINVVAGTIK